MLKNWRRSTLLMLFASLIGAGIFSATQGAFPISVMEAWALLAERLPFLSTSNPPDGSAAVVFFEVRVPRILLGGAAGAALALSGAMLQGLFRNPLADPGLIGVSAGSVFGAMLVLIPGEALLRNTAFASYALPLACIIGAALFTFLVYQLSKVGGKAHVATMLLVGVAISAIATALMGLAIYFSDNDQLRNFTFWTMGSLSSATWQAVAVCGSVSLFALLLMRPLARILNAFLLGEAEAFHMGIETTRAKRRIITLSSILVGTTVAFCGPIAFVGLIVPHICRLLLGADYRTLLPASAFLGAGFLILVDVLARTLLPAAELPIGIITTALGGPFFLGLLLLVKRKAAN